MLGKYNNIKEDRVLVAVPQSNLYSSNQVFNLKRFGPEIYVQIQGFVNSHYRLMRIYNLETLEDVGHYEYDELRRPWVDISVDCLEKSIGLHTYVLEFINPDTGDTFYQYFNYTIQDDDPDKPYIYMER